MPNAHILLVGTKIDLRDDIEMIEKLESKGETMVSYEEGEKFAHKLGLNLIFENFWLLIYFYCYLSTISTYINRFTLC